ncbi:restriction endonuclease subunit S [Laspinema sp. D1]|uniref:Restriction endonuclease subunit S n=1 Tax=Laspinema palackyanum D2a TaxID=2953684 RepID=A0ABT2MW88_9CYAN|nr:restriction endonuclease subunit S [Laspinema sp. D2a]
MMKGWEKYTLGDIYDVRDGTHDSPKYQPQGYPLITSKNLKNNGLNFEKVQYISEQDYNKINERSAVHKGDILLAMIGTIGNPVVVEVEPQFAIKNVALIKVPKNQNSYFLKYYLQTLYVESKMCREAKGTTQKFVGLGYLRNFPIFLPPLPEQKRIVAILDEAFEGIDAAIANTEKNLANARELFESYLNGVFTEKGEGWVEKKLHEILTRQPRNGWSPPANNHSPTGTPVLTLSAVTGFHFNQYKRKFTNAPTKKDAHYWLKNGEFLISRSNTPELVGHVAICENLVTPTICCDLIMKMQIDSSQADTKFIYWYFRTCKMRNLITSSAQGANPTMKKINKGIVQNLPVTFPSIQKQKNIANILDDFYLNTQELESIYQRKLEALKELKQSILEKAFTGELTGDVAKEVADTSKEIAA